MILHWTVLLLLLPLLHATANPDAEQEALQKYSSSCTPPFESNCFDDPSKNCTFVCFALHFCFRVTLADARLLPTAVAFLSVDKDGKMDPEVRYINHVIAEESRKKIKLGNPIQEFTFNLLFKSDKTEALKKIERVTDAILYIGSDHKDAYDPPTYGYNPEYLQLKDDGPIKGNLYEKSLFPFHSIDIKGTDSSSNLIDSHETVTEKDRQYISEPGIYRVNKADHGKISLLYYDPMRPDVTHLT